MSFVQSARIAILAYNYHGSRYLIIVVRHSIVRKQSSGDPLEFANSRVVGYFLIKQSNVLKNTKLLIH